MSANNQILIGRVGKEYWVWYNRCVDNEFDYKEEPVLKTDTLEKAITYAQKENTEYGYYCVGRIKKSEIKHK